MTSPETVDWTVVRPPAVTAGAEGLRERKKALMRQRLSDTATRMFLARGFDAVRVTEIAAACEVSEKTVFNYFPTKESLVLDRWDSTAKALREGIAEHGVHPLDAVRRILAGELGALTSWLEAQEDTAAAIKSVRRFGELVTTTPALRAYHNDAVNELVRTVSGLLADRAGLAADDPEPQIAATALVGLWGVHLTALKKYLDSAGTPAAVYQAVTADVEAAARLILAGLGSLAWTPAAAATTAP
jgi:AcrR family transcriptional regulator